MNWWVKANKEVKRLQPLTISLEKERNELLEKIKKLEASVEEKDNIIENLEERVDIEVEMNLKALDKSKEYHDRNKVPNESVKFELIRIECEFESNRII